MQILILISLIFPVVAILLAMPGWPESLGHWRGKWINGLLIVALLSFTAFAVCVVLGPNARAMASGAPESPLK